MTAATREGTAVAAVLWSRCLEEPVVRLHEAICELILGAGVLTGQVGGCVPPCSADCLAYPLKSANLGLAVSWELPNTESNTVFCAFHPHDLNGAVCLAQQTGHSSLSILQSQEPGLQDLSISSSVCLGSFFILLWH